MAKPTDTLAWATDAGATSDPGPTRKATGFLAGKRLPAKWLNYLLNKQGAWFQYLANLHDESEFLNKVYSWTSSHFFAAGIATQGILISHATNEYDYAAPRTRTVLYPLLTGHSDAANGWVANGAGVACHVANTGWAVPVSLPRGSVLTLVRAGVTSAPGATGVTMSVFKTVCDLATGAFVGGTLVAPSDEGLGDAQSDIVTSGTLSEAVDNAATMLKIDFRSPAIGGLVNWMELTFTDPGPRNV